MSGSQHSADRYGEAFAKLTPDTLEQLCAMVSDQVYFSDPFNQITGKAGFRAVFDHMYSVCNDPAFNITDIAHSKQASYLRWRMTGKLKSWPYADLNFEGMTEVRFFLKRADHPSYRPLGQRQPVVAIFANNRLFHACNPTTFQIAKSLKALMHQQNLLDINHAGAETTFTISQI